MASIMSWHVIAWPDSSRTLAAASRALSLPLLVLALAGGAGGVFATAADGASATAVVEVFFPEDFLDRWAGVWASTDVPGLAWAAAFVVGALLLRLVMVFLRHYGSDPGRARCPAT